MVLIASCTKITMGVSWGVVELDLVIQQHVQRIKIDETHVHFLGHGI